MLTEPGPRITVRGSHTEYRRPERATVQVRVGLEGPAPAAVHAAATRAATALTEDLRDLHDGDRGPVTWWSSDQLRTWAHRPWNQDGKLLPLVHHAQVELQAKFSDFDRLSDWLGVAMGVDGVSLQGIDWTLTEARKRDLVEQVRVAAVRDARDRAQAYADALGLGPVRVVALADAGMLGEGLAPTGGVGIASFARGAAGGGELAFTPQDVAVSTQVDAVFVTGPSTDS